MTVPDIYIREIATYMGLSVDLFDGPAKASMIEDVGRALITVLYQSTVTVLDYYPSLDTIYTVFRETM